MYKLTWRSHLAISFSVPLVGPPSFMMGFSVPGKINYRTFDDHFEWVGIISDLGSQFPS